MSSRLEHPKGAEEPDDGEMEIPEVNNEYFDQLAADYVEKKIGDTIP